MVPGADLITAVAAVAALLLLDVLALRYGVDSRDRIPDDWARPSDPEHSFPFWR
jgi:hypothetical protein